MNRTIFVQCFKLFFFQKVMIVLPSLLVLIGGVQIASSSQFIRNLIPQAANDQGLNWFLLVTMLVSGFISGAATFSQIKEHHLAFVQSLPMERSHFWLIAICAQLTSVVLAAVIVFGLRPSLLALMEPATNGVLKVAAFGLAYIALFAAGLCFTMLVQRTMIAAGIAIPIVGVAMVVSDFYSSISGGSMSNSKAWSLPVSLRTDDRFMLFALFVQTILWILLSLLFYRRGEFTLPVRRVKNWATLAAVLVCLPLLLSATFDSGVFARYDPWTIAYHPDIAITQDGRYVAIVERRKAHLQFGRVQVIDSNTGRSIQVDESHSVVAAFWSSNNEVLNLIESATATSRLGYLLPPADRVVRFSSEGKMLGVTLFAAETVMDANRHPDGRLLLLLRSGSKARLLALDDAGNSAELLNVPIKHSASIIRTKSTVMVATYIGNPQYRVETDNRERFLDHMWTVLPEKREVPWVNAEKFHTFAAYALPDGLASTTTAGSELESRFPLATLVAQSHYTNPMKAYFLSWPVPGGPTIFNSEILSTINVVFAVVAEGATGKGNFYVLDTTAKDWKNLGEVSQPKLAGDKLPRIAHSFGSIWADSDSGIAAFFTSSHDGARETFLYDANRGEKILLTTQPVGEPPIMNYGNPLPTTDIPGTAILYYSGEKRGLIIYNPGKPIQNIELAGRFIRYVGQSGKQIYETDEGMFVRSATGEVRKIWDRH